MNTVFLLTGSNLGDSIRHIYSAADSIDNTLGRVLKKSHIYRSESWGYKSSKVFYNQCIELETKFSPQAILEKVLKVEMDMGRVRIGKGYSDREIDIDILFFGEEIIEDEELYIPHPRMHLRRFALVPMAEIALDFIHPVLKKSISELLTICQDKSLVTIDYGT
jgi:2-amino-4-hydroxy-6-hydroxymethyldihydropteridine diphosphokinase